MNQNLPQSWDLETLLADPRAPWVLGGLVAVLLLIWLISIWRASARAQAAEARMAELSGRMAQLAEGHASHQRHLADRLQGQERAMSEAFDSRMSSFSRRLADYLQDSQQRQTTTLGQLRERLAVIDQAQQRIVELSGEVVGLQDILSNKQARGAFGEVQLAGLLADMLPASSYRLQATLAGGSRRVDCLIELPPPLGPLAIDAKFPLEAYRAFVAAETEEQRRAALKRLAADLKKHVDDIAQRYILPGETADSAILFLPSEAVFAELHARLPEAVDYGFRRRVWIVSPATMMATLTTLRAVLKDVKLREAASAIQAELRLLLEDAGRLGDRVDKLERHFENARQTLDQVRISTDKLGKRGQRIDVLQLGGELEDDGALEAQDQNEDTGPRRAVG